MQTQTNPQLSETYVRPNGELITVTEAANFLVLPDSLPGVKATSVPLFTRVFRWASYFFNSKNFVW